MTTDPFDPFNDEAHADRPHNELSSHCIVNYIWINANLFEASHQEKGPICGVPLHYIDLALVNAKRYPDAYFQIWIDPRFLEGSLTVDIVRNHLKSSGCKNVQLRDLGDVPYYSTSPYFATGTDTPVWHRADIARLMVTEQTLYDYPDCVAIYSDFDVADISLNSERFVQTLDHFGFALGAPKSFNHECPENGYFAFTRHFDAKQLLETMLHNAYEATGTGSVQYERNDVFNAYLSAAIDYFKEHGQSMTDCLLYVTESTHYVIPRNPAYEGISI